MQSYLNRFCQISTHGQKSKNLYKKVCIVGDDRSITIIINKLNIIYAYSLQ